CHLFPTCKESAKAGMVVLAGRCSVALPVVLVSGHLDHSDDAPLLQAAGEVVGRAVHLAACG
ncbi:MAG: hypothetical protein RMI89_11740, partial [Gloeomargarita sp. SKYBB_i_bin120]|nr:hypothetical protein [Gloeomargarita sp. SKYB120]MDW8179183.1 hypothetical protein [Gloeomargarita sp. SKYBB_i_bin120]